ncbi:hypothetical protein [Natronomonas sp.]|uniref:hypothetical protein n=1 Tax=Natronomonas sp. TaxID=2184060 RepID=UPI0039E36A43
MSNRELDQPFLGVLFASFRLVDVVALCAVPVALVAVFLLPMELRRAYLFSYGAPTPVTAFTANYIHLEIGHLLSNVGGYLLIVPVTYLLSALSGHRKRFYVAFVTFLLAFPVALSYLNLAIERPGLAVGFSGVLMAFVGFLPLAVTGYLQTYFDLDDALDASSALFFVGLALIATVSVNSFETYGLAVASLLAATLYALSVTENRDAFLPNVKAASGVAGHFELASLGLFLTLLVPLAAFPGPSVTTGVVNLYVHLLGYALGFIATYLTVQVADSISVNDGTTVAAR